MVNYTLVTKVKRELSPVFCFKTQKKFLPELNLNLTFHLSYEDTDWHICTLPRIIISKVINLENNQIVDFEHLPIIAQLNAKRLCREYLELNFADPYLNIFPFYNLPFRYSDVFNQDKSHFAKIIHFRTKSKL